MGHVPSGPLSAEGAGSDVPGRQHREAGAGDLHLTLGRAAEDLAAWFLARRGVGIIARNVKLPGGEIDILAQVEGERTVVEVRSRRPDSRWPVNDPVEALTAEKAAQVRRLAGRLRPPAPRVDLVAVGFGRDGVEIRWVPRVA